MVRDPGRAAHVGAEPDDIRAVFPLTAQSNGPVWRQVRVANRIAHESRGPRPAARLPSPAGFSRMREPARHTSQYQHCSCESRDRHQESLHDPAAGFRPEAAPVLSFSISALIWAMSKAPGLNSSAFAKASSPRWYSPVWINAKPSVYHVLA